MKLSFQKVINTPTYDNKPLFELCLEDEKGQENSFQCTKNHPFYTNENAFVRTDKLHLKHTLHSIQQTKPAINKIQNLNASAKVFDLTVESTHTYFVGKAGIWVHNSNAGATLGEGYYGKAVRYGDRVKKYYHDGVPGNFDVNVVAEDWNRFYSNIYDGELNHLATAYTEVENGVRILNTPYVSGNHFGSSTLDMASPYRTHLNHSLESMGMGIADMKGNMILHNNRLVVIDFDNAYNLNNPPSVRSRAIMEHYGISVPALPQANAYGIDIPTLPA